MRHTESTDGCLLGGFSQTCEWGVVEMVVVVAEPSSRSFTRFLEALDPAFDQSEESALRLFVSRRGQRPMGKQVAGGAHAWRAAMSSSKSHGRADNAREDAERFWDRLTSRNPICAGQRARGILESYEQNSADRPDRVSCGQSTLRYADAPSSVTL